MQRLADAIKCTVTKYNPCAIGVSMQCILFETMQRMEPGYFALLLYPSDSSSLRNKRFY